MARAEKSYIPPTRAAVEALRPRVVEEGKPQGLFTYDAYFQQPRGFHVRVYPSGTKIFFLRYRDPDGGTPARYRAFRIGVFGELTVAQAMEQAVAARGRLAVGERPHEEKWHRSRIPNVEQLVEDYVAELRRTRKATYAHETERMLRRKVVPRFGRELIVNITGREMQQLHASLSATPVGANRVLMACSGMFAFAIRRGELTENPARLVRRTPEQSRDVEPLTDAQVGALGAAILEAEQAGEAWQAVGLIRFIFFTGCRRSEAEGLQWSEIDRERARVVFRDSKGTKRGSRGTDRRPLGAAVFELLDGIREVHTREGIVSPWVFPAPGDPSRSYGNLDRRWQAIRKAAGLPSLRLHDLRHDVATDYGMKYPASVVKAMAGHATLSSTSKYVHAKDDPMTRAADDVTGDRAKRLANVGAATRMAALHSHRLKNPEHPPHAERKSGTE